MHTGNAKTLVGEIDYDAARGSVESGEDELVPLALIDRRLDVASTVKTWRKHRALKQAELAKVSKVSRAGTIATRKKLAALNVDMENLA